MHSIYRLETSNGHGVYRVCYELGYAPVLEDHLSHPWWPAPDEDGMGRSAWSDMIFGFASLAQMRDWFNGPERLYLSSCGILLSHYQARGPIISGKRQVAFYRGCAELIWQRPLNHF